MAVNPNYPNIAEDWGPSWTAGGAAIPSTRWVNLVGRTVDTASVRRGKQYELDQPQSGEYQVALSSQDGALDPTNASGPWGGAILPYQPYRRRAQWPATANLLDAVVATCGDGYSVGTFPAGFPVSTTTITNGGSIAVPATPRTAYQGTNVFSTTVNTNVTSGSRIFYCGTTGIQPGQKFTFQCRVRNVTDGTTLPVKAHLGYYGTGTTFASASYGTTATLTGSSTADTWTLITVTGTAPTTGGVYGLSVGISGAGTISANAALETDAWQLETGGSASAWATPGTWYPMFTGFTERWPTEWADGGTYGKVQPTGVDAFALLSQITLDEVFPSEIEQHSPRFMLRLAEAAGATAATDSTNTFDPIPLTTAKGGGAGAWTFGNSPDGSYLGTSETMASLRPAGAGVAVPSPATFLDLRGAGILPMDAGQGFTRLIAFRYAGSNNPTDQAYIWSTLQLNSWASGNLVIAGIQLFIENGGQLRLSVQPAGSLGTVVNMGNNVTDGKWHLCAFAINGTSVTTMLDGAIQTATLSATLGITSLWTDDSIGAQYSRYNSTAQRAFYGDLAYPTEFSTALSASDLASLWNAWSTAFKGEATGARYSRILRYAGYSGASNVGTGLTTNMGPATDLPGTDAMSALNGVATTENGEHFVAADGTLTFRGRSARYNPGTPVLTFGDGPGELPYEDLQLDFDPTHLSNDVTVTQSATSQNFRSVNSASVASYFTRTMARTINSADAGECQDAADYLCNRYSGPLTRVQSLKVHPSACPSLWPSVLALELGSLVTVNRRPPGAPMISVVCFVEQVQWDMDSTGEAFLTLQCSPADPNTYATFDGATGFDQTVFAY